MLRIPALAHVTVAGLLLLTGCAALEWHKTSVSAEERERNLAACTTQSRAEALRHAAVTDPVPRITVDGQGRAVVIREPRHDTERFVLEQDLLRACMRDRGYRLQERATGVH